MTPTIGYSNTRVNSIDSSSEKDEFGKWIHTPNFKAIRSASNAQDVNNRTRQMSFATLLKQADQDNGKAAQVELRPANRQFTNIDILA